MKYVATFCCWRPSCCTSPACTFGWRRGQLDHAAFYIALGVILHAVYLHSTCAKKAA
jgi:hypothetical protein